MAWTDVTNGQIDTDSPVTQSLMTAIRDNFPALAAGDAGAPRIQASACGTPAAGATRAGAILGGGASIIQTTVSDLSTHVGTWNALSNGVVRVRYQQSIQAASNRSCAVDIFKNGSLVNTQTTTSSSAVQRIYDVAVAAGDNLSVGLRRIDVGPDPSGAAAIYEVLILQNRADAIVGA